MATRFAFLKLQGYVLRYGADEQDAVTLWLVNLDQVVLIADAGEGYVYVHLVPGAFTNEQPVLVVEGTVEAFNDVIASIGRGE